MGQVILSGVSKGMTVPAPYAANFADNTWAKIIDVCQKNAVPATWVVGDQKTMTINGTDYTIDIIGKNHDTYSDGSGTAPLTFQMHDCFSNTYAMNSSATNSGGWNSCSMRLSILPIILSLMPSEVQNGIKEVNKLTSAGSMSSTINTASDKLFLLSEIEIYGERSGSFAGEGKQYAYYTAGNSKIKKLSGTDYGWWMRSPHNSANNLFLYVNAGYNGTSSNDNASVKYGVSFAFCF